MTTQTQPLILSVSEITQAIKLTLESTFTRVWVKGEVTNPKLQSSGHFYFSLNDNFASIRCVCFKGDRAKLVMLPKAGDQILVRAEMSLYAPQGSYQLIVKELSHVGVGDQLIKLELLKQKLHKLGYFSSDRKRALPHFPKRIGVVTSPTGAVIQDIIKVLGRRMSGFHLILNPVRVQGDGADLEIAEAIAQFNRYQLADVLIVGRGGGSVEDLASFNSECVATAIFQSQIPIVSAVGHETDITIADLVADVRASTPSQAAEIISHDEAVVKERLSKFSKDIAQIVAKELHLKQNALSKLIRHQLFTRPEYLFADKKQRLDDVTESLETAIVRVLNTFKQDLMRFRKTLALVRPSNKIAERKQKLKNMHNAISLAVSQRLSMKKRSFMACSFAHVIPSLVQKKLQENRRKLENVARQLDALHPKRVLAKGYSIVFSQKDGSVISSAKDLEPQESIKIAFFNGEADANITTIRVTDDNRT